MANNLIQIKRTSVSGRAANTTTLPNPGELALNMTDGILYSTNGSVVFEIGANNTNATITGNLTVRSIVANGSPGTNTQILTSDGANVYWSTPSTSTSVRQQYTANGTQTSFTVTSGYTSGELDVYVNGVKFYNGTEVDVSSGSTFDFTVAPPNGALVEAVGFKAVNPANYIANTYSGTLSGNLVFSGANNTFNTLLRVGSNVTVNTSTLLIGTTTVNSTSVTVGTTNVASGSITVGANVSVNTSTLLIGTTSVNSSAISLGSTNVTSGSILLGSNVSFSTSTLFVGNSTVNTSITANQITLSGANVITTSTVIKVYYANNTQAYP